MKAKRFFAALLCLCMAVSLLPAGVASAADSSVQKYKVQADGTLEYGFYIGGSYGWADSNNSTAPFPDWDNVCGRGDDVVVMGGSAGAAGWYPSSGDGSGSRSITWLTYGVGDYIGIAVDVPTAGTYSVHVGQNHDYDNGDYEYYLVPITDEAYNVAYGKVTGDNAAGAQTKAKRQGIKDTIDAAIAAGQYKYGKTVGANTAKGSAVVLYSRLENLATLNAGKYMFVARCIGGAGVPDGERTRHYFHGRGLALEPINTAEPTYAFRNIAPIPVATAKAGLMLSYPGSIVASTASFGLFGDECSKFDDRSGDVDAWTAFKVNVYNQGSYNVSVGYVKDTKGAIIDYYLVPASVASDEAGINTAIADSKYYLGKTNTYGATEKVVEKLAIKDISAGEYYFVAKTVGRSAGTTIYYNAFISELKLTKYVEPVKHKEYDDGTLEYGFYIGGSYGWTDPDADFANANGKGEDVVVFSDTRFAVSGFDQAKGQQSWQKDYPVPAGVTQYLSYEVGKWGAIQVKVPTAGTYNAFVGQYYDANYAGNYDHYLVPVDANDNADAIRTKVNAAIASGNYKLGSTVGSDSTRKTYVIYDLMENRASLEAGKYMYVAVCTGGKYWENSAKTEKRYYLYLRGLVLEPFNADEPTYKFRSPMDTPVAPGSPVGDISLSSSITKSSVTTITGVQTYGISGDWRSDSAGDNTWIAVNVNIKNAGWYAPTVSYTKKMGYMYVDHYLVPKSVATDAASIEAAIAGDAASNKYYLGQTNNTYSTSNQVSGFELECDPVNLASGDYYYVAKLAPKSMEVYGPSRGGTSKYYGLSLDGISFAATTEPEDPKAEIPASDVFGKTYAYVKDGTVYFLGGLKGIEGYTEVGFEVAVNGEAAGDIKTSEVYESFVIKGETKAASAWDASYIFITSMSDLEAGDVVTLKPYVANGEAKTYHGDLSLELKI